jgi:hypothetical protein
VYFTAGETRAFEVSEPYCYVGECMRMLTWSFRVRFGPRRRHDHPWLLKTLSSLGLAVALVAIVLAVVMRLPREQRVPV